MPGEDRQRWDAPGPAGSTPLSEDEAGGLLPAWVATRADLNLAEQDNIWWARRQRRWRAPSPEQVLDDLTVRALHKDMFGQVWSWAGTYRRRDTNIGSAWTEVPTRVRALTGDALAWLDGPGAMGADEAAARLHHRLVSIHPFPNGNGRHSREMADLLLRGLGQPEFTWGRVSLVTASSVREEYIAALRQADAGDLKPLLAFARS